MTKDGIASRVQDMPKPPPAESRFWKVFEAGTRVNVVLFRLTKGKVGGKVGKNARVLLLHHTGRKSGNERVSPLIYLDDAPDLVIVASKGGTTKHPAWFHNVTAMDTTLVELPGGEKRRVRPRVATAEERETLWPRLVAIYKPYEDYASYTERTIPLVVLQPA
jgi:deazaflavin-dependent oxidoreductase (nitroreductase family)